MAFLIMTVRTFRYFWKITHYKSSQSYCIHTSIAYIHLFLFVLLIISNLLGLLHVDCCILLNQNSYTFVFIFTFDLKVGTCSTSAGCSITHSRVIDFMTKVSTYCTAKNRLGRCDTLYIYDNHSYSITSATHARFAAGVGYNLYNKSVQRSSQGTFLNW